MSQTKQLYDLQEVDSDIERVTEALQQLEVKLNDNAELLQAKSEFEQEKNDFQELQKKQQALEWEIDDIRSKIDPMQKKLYSGSVKNPKELMGMQEEVNLLTKKVNQKEDSALELMSEAEGSQVKLDKTRQQVEELEKQWREKEKVLLAEKDELETQLSNARSSRESLIPTIDPTALDLYEYLRKSRRKPTVAKASDSSVTSLT